MSEMAPSESGDHSKPDLELYAEDFDAWERELLYEEQSTELSRRFGQLALGETIEHTALDEAPEEDSLPIKPKKPDDEVRKPDPLSISSETSSEPGWHVTEDEMFSAAMGLIYFATGFPADEMFEK